MGGQVYKYCYNLNKPVLPNYWTGPGLKRPPAIIVKNEKKSTGLAIFGEPPDWFFKIRLLLKNFQ
jgi:hypothetical protein